MRRFVPPFAQIFALPALALALACGGGGEPAADQTDAVPDATAPATPAPTDAPALIAEIRAGIDELPAMTAADPVAARRRAVDLYATRQERVEGLWGPRGVAGPTPELGERVLEAETSFHELMALLNQEAAPDSAAVAAAVTDLDARLQTVLDTAAAAPPQAP